MGDVSPPDLLEGWLAVCGLKREAQIWGGRAVVGGGRSDLLTERLRAAIDAGRPRGVVSFGVAGALQPALSVGRVVAARAVCTTAGERWGCDRRVMDGLTEHLPNYLRAQARTTNECVVGVDAVAVDASSKQALARFGAIVDMESHVAARCAAEARLPLAVIRVVSDGVDHALPPAAIAGFRPDGGIDVGAVIKSLALDPRQLPALLRMARTTATAFATLKQLAKSLRA